jgi:hypothetical protein
VAKGFAQHAGIDYDEVCEYNTLEPVSKHNMLRDQSATAAINDWFLHQLHVETEFQLLIQKWRFICKCQKAIPVNLDKFVV